MFTFWGFRCCYKKFWTLFELVECAGGFYNGTCTGVCGHCVNGEVCLQNNGYCVNGCSNHFFMPLCQGNTSSFVNMYVFLLTDSWIKIDIKNIRYKIANWSSENCK